MCATCGCGDDGATITAMWGHSPGKLGAHPPDGPTRAAQGRQGDARAKSGQPQSGNGHPHGHTHPHDHDHEHPHTETISLEQKVLAKNDVLAEQNRQWLAERGILAFNMTSSPGAGKTTLLERTIRHLGSQRQISVIEGDQETLLDAERITAAGARAVQVNTGAGCHLDAEMIDRALHTLAPDSGSLLFIENVGNLVCPALFDLGEHSKVVVISVTEGTDKPLKYPHMFAAAGLVLINKTDLMPYVDFDLDRCAQHARSVNPSVEILPVSATKGDGLDAWFQWIDARANELRVTVA
ncbi:hydrogenase nickel incorporation protein HypB [Mycobacterium neglectum]|jgi:hydrogenase nickel incorporation protein HypB|uniref:hydrogenase nickel incorporation protein HypB n=1 Tax=Mycobacterium neglectum TaxID=242737 RepID=UPI000BFEEE51|nr:hydrogenase nickel incorporation protein HypB [Mycobacterium neglectum]